MNISAEGLREEQSGRDKSKHLRGKDKPSMSGQVDTCACGIAKDQRVALWDNVKMALITMVVVGHFIEPYVGDSHLLKALFLFIYSFHMPLFFFVAGLFHKNERIKEKTLGFLSIYIAFKVVVALSTAVCGKGFSLSLLKESGAPWYMLAMAVFVCVTYLLRNVDPKAVLLLAVALACCAGYDKSIGDVLAASRIIVFFPFYYVGSVFPKAKVEQLAARRNWKMIGLAILLVWLAICYFQIDVVYVLRHLFTGRNPYNDTVRHIGWIVRLGCYALTTLAGMGIILIMPTKKLGYLTTVGTRTLQIYFWHIPIRNILRYTGCLDRLMAMGAPGKLLLLLAAVCVVLLCSVKPLEQPTAYLMKAFGERTAGKLEMNREGLKKKALLWIPIALFFSFSVLFYGPLGIYLSNAQELWFSLGTVLKIVGFMALAGLVLLTVLGIVLPEKASAFCAKLLFGVSLALYIQGNYINISYGSGVLDGSEIVWSDYTAYACVDTLVWIVCIALPFVLGLIPKLRKGGYVRKGIIALSLFFVVIQLPAMVVQFINYTPNEQRDIQVTTEGMYDLASDENTIVFLLDTYDERYFRDFIEKHPEYQEKLADFVHYDNYMTSAARTIVAMPSLLTGQPFLRDSTYSEYISRIWSQDNVLQEMAASGVDVRVFANSLYFAKEATAYIANMECGETAVSDYGLLTQKLYKITGFTFAPHVAKQQFWFNTAEFDEAKQSVDNFAEDDARNIAAYTENGFTVSDSYDKAFRFYYFNGLHPPFTLGADGKKSSDATRETANIALMDMILAMLEEMKEKGIYDNANIIITGDHGDENKAEWTLFLVKEAGHTGPLETDHAPVSGFDLPVILGDMFDLSVDGRTYGMHLSELTESTERERHFFQNTSGSSRVMIREFMTNSDAGDVDALTPVAVYEDDVDQPYVLGTELSFAADATGNRYTVSGFEINTGWRTLLCGHEAVIQIPIDDLPAEGTVTVHVGVYSADSVARNAIIYANDYEKYKGTVDKSQNKTGIEFEVPVDVIRQQDDVLTIRFVLPDIAEGDETTRSFSLKTLWIK